MDGSSGGCGQERQIPSVLRQEIAVTISEKVPQAKIPYIVEGLRELVAPYFGVAKFIGSKETIDLRSYTNEGFQTRTSRDILVEECSRAHESTFEVDLPDSTEGEKPPEVKLHVINFANDDDPNNHFATSLAFTLDKDEERHGSKDPSRVTFSTLKCEGPMPYSFQGTTIQIILDQQTYFEDAIPEECSADDRETQVKGNPDRAKKLLRSGSTWGRTQTDASGTPETDLRNVDEHLWERKPYEIFAKLYHSQVDSEKSTRCDAQGIKGRSQLAVWHEVAKEMYGSATEEQLAEVKREMDAANEVKDTRSELTGEKATESPSSPSTYLRYLKKLPTLLNTAITPAVEKAGVIALVTIVGPDPSKRGRVATRTLQFGDKPTTPLFSEDWVGHDWFVEEVTRFAGKHEFPPELCATRSLDAMPSCIDSDSEEEDIADVESMLKVH
ncbi:hypothetical protein NMY22_g14333 [Coprinellus aureogranulatus]|nr:hypothetical protein NMY22_g14333 [Coprinellus aureogranulatus]